MARKKKGSGDGNVPPAAQTPDYQRLSITRHRLRVGCECRNCRRQRARAALSR